MCRSYLSLAGTTEGQSSARRLWWHVQGRAGPRVHASRHVRHSGGGRRDRTWKSPWAVSYLHGGRDYIVMQSLLPSGWRRISMTPCEVASLLAARLYPSWPNTITMTANRTCVKVCSYRDTASLPLFTKIPSRAVPGNWASGIGNLRNLTYSGTSLLELVYRWHHIRIQAEQVVTVHSAQP